MAKKKDVLQKIYEKNPPTGNYLIQISLNQYSDIFNDFDSAPFRKRDIDPDLRLFLEDCSMDIPLKKDIDISFHIAQSAQDSAKEQVVIASFKTYYSFYLSTQKRTLKDIYHNAILYVFISFISLFLSFFLENLIPRSIFTNTMLEGLNIGGWVFLWEAISFFFFKRKKYVHEIMEYERFLRANIYFNYDIKA